MKKKIAVLGNGWAYEFSESILEGIQKASANCNVDIYYFTCYRFHNPDKSINTTGYRAYDELFLEDFDGVILLSTLFEDEDSLARVTEKIKALKIPAVSLLRKIEGIPFVEVDNFCGFYELINHLIKVHNISDFAYLGGIQDDVQNTQRQNAFTQALEENNITLKKDRFIQNTDWSFKTGYEEGLKFLKSNNPPQAIVCSNDTLALGVIRAAYECNIPVPKKIKIVGFDDISFAQSTIPSLSTVLPNSIEMGKKAIEILFSKEKEMQNITIKSQACIRQSCGCESELSSEQKFYSIKSLYNQDEEERFSTHLRHTEDVFINDNNFHILWDACQNFYEKRHYFEGENFAILLKKGLVNSLLYDNVQYDDLKETNEFQVFINIQDGKKVKPSDLKAKDLLPKNMLSKNNNLFLFIPLVYRKNLYGYYITKNNLQLLHNKRGYTWTKNFANSIEKFREKTKYLLLSQKYLGLSTKDALSGIYNRVALELFAKDLYETNRHSDLFTIICFIDINYLKIINDKHGHLHGDLAIKIVAEEIKNCIPEKWLPVRYGGDEFVIIGTSDTDKNLNFFDQLNEKLQMKKQEMSLPYDISVSTGITAVPPDSYFPLEKEIDRADSIMYKNKQAFHAKHDALLKQKI